MSVCLLCLVVEGACNIQVAHALNVIVRNILTSPDNHPDLKLTVSLIADLELSVERVFLVGDDIQPEPDRTLGDFRLLRHEFMGFDGVVEDHIVFLIEGTVL
jgi:hypothetical protein